MPAKLNLHSPKAQPVQSPPTIETADDIYNPGSLKNNFKLLSTVAAESWNAQGRGCGAHGFLALFYLSSLSFECYQYGMRGKQGPGRRQLVVMLLS